MNEEKFNELSEKVDRLYSLFAAAVTKDGKNQTEKIMTLADMGFRPFEIGTMLDIKNSTVRGTINRVRNK